MNAPGLAALAGAVVSVSAGAVRGVDAAFEKLFRLEDETPSPDEADKASGMAEAEAALASRWEQLTAEFQAIAADRLREAGIALEAPLVLENDPLGGVRVAGGHPRAAMIERVLNDDPSLMAMFSELSQVQGALSRQRRSEELDRLYALDPTAARRLDQDSGWEEDALRVTLKAA